MLPIILIAAGVGFLLGACSRARDADSEHEGGYCADCHIAPDGDPPFTPLANTGTDTYMECRHPLSAAGAHDSHLLSGTVMKSLACAECHHVPDSVVRDERHLDYNLEGHDNCRAEIDTTGSTFPLGATISYSAETMTCGGCHDLSAYGDPARSPAWDAEQNPREDACLACHDAEAGRTANGIPVHPESDECGDCHSESVAPGRGSRNEIKDKSHKGTHMDGALNLDPLAEDGRLNCNSCHDFMTAPAENEPAYDTKFFHWRHIGKNRKGQIASDYSCSICHDDLVPSARNYRTMATHIDGEIDVKFSGLAVRGGRNPAWNEETSRCESTYCHDQGGRNPAPAAEPNDAMRACDSCHDMPPDNATPPVHVDDTTCSRCHEETAVEMPDGTQGIADISKHVNARVEIGALECYDCHDSIQSAESALHHAKHEAVGFACPTCHGNYGEGGADEPGHPSGGRAQISFRGTAEFTDRAMSFDTDTGACSTYCHQGSEGGELSNVSWRETSGYDSGACTGCHGDPPAINNHPQIQFCSVCHTETVSTDETGRTRLGTGGLHINHVREKRDGLDNCVSCHEDLRLAENPDSAQVHETHEAGGTTMPSVICGTCHSPVQNVEDPAHIGNFDRTAEIAFSGLAVGAEFEREGRTCSFEAGGCHLLAGSPGTRPAPSWLITPRNPDICNECHIAQPQETHQSAPQCRPCHPETAGPDRTIANRANHINLATEADVSCDRCHESDRTHEVHTTMPILSMGYSCAECHGEETLIYALNIWAGGHRDGAVDFSWGQIATSGGHSPVYDLSTGTCLDTACHNRGGGLATPRWDSGPRAGWCSSCHSIPPPSPPHQEDGLLSCPNCHGYSPTADVTLHADGDVNMRPGAELCTTCHGFPPPPDTRGGTAVASRGVGQHAVHSERYSCDTCHGEDSVPEAMALHRPRDRNVNINFTGLATAGDTDAVYDHVSQTCSVYCHGATIAGGQIPAPRWTDASGEISSRCDSCHGEPPPDEVHEIWDIMRNIGFPMECMDCHGAVVDADREVINDALHINGSVDTME